MCLPIFSEKRSPSGPPIKSQSQKVRAIQTIRSKRMASTNATKSIIGSTVPHNHRSKSSHSSTWENLCQLRLTNQYIPLRLNTMPSHARFWLSLNSANTFYNHNILDMVNSQTTREPVGVQSGSIFIPGITTIIVPIHTMSCPKDAGFQPNKWNNPNSSTEQLQ